MSTSVVRVPENVLKEIVSSILTSVGLSPEDAAIGADVLTAADARGVNSHGIVSLPGYVRQMQQGGIDPKAEIKCVRESGSTCLIDGRNGMGQVVSVKATRKAIGLAREYGSSVVCVRNSSHFGAGEYYTVMCALENQIGMAISNATPVLGVPGGRGPAIGNNPISVAVPSATGGPIVLDMALSVVAIGKMMNMAKSGQTIPDGWITDEKGRPSRDPYVLDHGGAAAAFGRHKGYAMAVIAEILSGVLPGAGVTNELRDWILYPDQPTLIGHFFAAIDVSRFQEVSAFKNRVSSLASELRSGPKADEGNRLLVPGDLEHEAQQKSLSMGVGVPVHAWKALVELAQELGVEVKDADVCSE